MAAKLKIGIRNIEFALIEDVRGQGGAISLDSFVWTCGITAGRPPEIVSAQITANAKTASLVLPRECCEDSAVRVNRMEVRQAISDCARVLTA